MPHFCSHCGAEVQSLFCGECGHKRASVDEVPREDVEKVQEPANDPTVTKESEGTQSTLPGQAHDGQKHDEGKIHVDGVERVGLIWRAARSEI